MSTIRIPVLTTAIALALGSAVVIAEDQRVEQTTVSTDAQGNTTTTTTVRFEDWDADADGVLIKSEMPADAEFSTVWMEYDADGDLRITPVEFKAYTVAGADVQQVEKSTTTVRNADGSATQMTTTTTVTFEDWDADADGVLIKSEIPAGSEFATVWMDFDADKNLVISPAEFDAWIVIDDREEAE